MPPNDFVTELQTGERDIPELEETDEMEYDRFKDGEEFVWKPKKLKRQSLRAATHL